jgi:hypothetical protein
MTSKGEAPSQWPHAKAVHTLFLHMAGAQRHVKCPQVCSLKQALYPHWERKFTSVGHLLCAGSVLGIHVVLITALRSKCYYPHFTGEKIG